MSRCRLTFLGTGSPTYGAFMPSGALVDEKVLLDAPTSIAWALHRVGVGPRSVRTVLLSHFHADHTFGLPPFFIEIAYGGGRENPPTEPLAIIGPPGTEAWLPRLLELAYPSPGEKLKELALLEPRSLAPGESVETAGFTVTAFAMDHIGVPAQGYLLERDDIALGYTGDTQDCDGFRRLAERSRVLVSEATSIDLELTGHLNLRRLESVSAGRRVFAVHRAYETESRDVLLPRDLESFEIDGGAVRRLERE